MPRWPAAVAFLLIGASYLALSEYVTFGPRVWVPGLIMVLIVPLLIAQVRGHYRLARWLSYGLITLVTASVVLRVFFLVTTLSVRGTSAVSLLVDAVVIWVSTIVTFALWYWEIDGGGPANRTMDSYASEDFLFPQISQQGSKSHISWVPNFLDYLFLAFNTSAAFSPTDTPVLSRRAKILTVVQSVLSLVVLFVLVSWAVNAL